MKETSDFRLACQIGFAMAIVKAIVISVTQIASPDAIWFPIFGFATIFQTSGLLDILGVILIGLFFVLGARPATLAFGAGLVLLTWMARYSGMGAFVPQAFYSLLFFSIVGATVTDELKDREQLKHAATAFLFLIFFASAIQKMNVSYMTGVEFTSVDGFFGPIHRFFGTPPLWLTTKVLPILSVTCELGLAVGLLLRPRVFAHLCVFFLLVLSFMHTSALYAYLAILPLVVLIDSNSLKVIRSPRVRDALLGNEYFWYFVHVLLLGSMGWKNRDVLTYFGRHWIAAGVLIGIHVWIFRRSFQTEGGAQATFFRSWRPLYFKGLTGVLVIVALSPVAAWLGAPAPIGYTMFSGREARFASYEIRLQGRDACLRLERNFVALSFTDVSISRTYDTCRVSGPTESGAISVARSICADPILRSMVKTMEVKSSEDETSRPYSCDHEESR